jgi:hypothetical protein
MGELNVLQRARLRRHVLILRISLNYYYIQREHICHLVKLRGMARFCTVTSSVRSMSALTRDILWRVFSSALWCSSALFTCIRISLNLH